MSDLEKMEEEFLSKAQALPKKPPSVKAMPFPAAGIIHFKSDMSLQQMAEFKRQWEKTVKKAVDIDTDAGMLGVSKEGGQVAMRVSENYKCDGCIQYDKNVSACTIGLVPLVCGDGSHPEIGYAPVIPDRIASRNWRELEAHHTAETGNAPSVGGRMAQDQMIPYRIEVLGDSMLALSERMTLVKAAVKDPGAVIGHIWHKKLSASKRKEIISRHEGGKKKKKHEGKGRPPKAWFDKMKTKIAKGVKHLVVTETIEELTGVTLIPSSSVSIAKSNMSLSEFADAMGTTEQVVRDIARRLGDKEDFAKFIKSKLPDIRMAWGLDERAVGHLYNAARNFLRSMSDTEWQALKSASFQDGTDDESLARAIAQYGILDNNAVYGGAVFPGEGTRAAPLPEPERVQDPEQKPIAGFVGGNLHLANDITRR